jgi:glyoxylase-like metal-dependent hydrolase (beta-lactamase superfamily II)/rhodanese-related sulfurtransferase
MQLDLIVTPGLGDNSYLLTSGDEAAVVDPQRDIGRFLEASEARGARISAVVETHVHNDYVSGALELRAATGARIWGPSEAGYAFGFEPVSEGTEIHLGDGALVARPTPGHTPEHTSYLLLEADREPVAIFSGGSLIVGSAGRTDLLGDDRADELTRLQFRTMRGFASLPDRVLLLPTHGAGSFCASAPPGDERTSTIGRERAQNPALADVDEETFVRRQLAGLQAFPSYYAQMAPINRSGPPVLGEVPVPGPISPDEAAAALANGARIVDTRDGGAFASEHVPGSLNVPLEPSFAAYVGWLLPFATPIVLVVTDRNALVEAATQLCRIGWDDAIGYLDGGVAAWRSSEREVTSYEVLEVDRLVDELRADRTGAVLDVRQRTEWDAGHLPGSRHVFVGELPGRLVEFGPDAVTTVVCASGYRASMAASLLAGVGVPVRLVARSGVPRALRLLERSA